MRVIGFYMSAAKGSSPSGSLCVRLPRCPLCVRVCVCLPGTEAQLCCWPNLHTGTGAVSIGPGWRDLLSPCVSPAGLWGSARRDPWVLESAGFSSQPLHPQHIQILFFYIVVVRIRSEFNCSCLKVSVKAKAMSEEW